MSLMFIRVFAGFLAGLLLGIVIMRRTVNKKTQGSEPAETAGMNPTVSSTTSR